MDHDTISAKDIMTIARRRKWSIILPSLAIFFVSAAIAFLLPPKYRSISTILIEDQEIPREYVSANVTTYADQRLQAINQQVMGSTRLIEIINRFKLYEDLKKTKTTEEILAKMRKDIKFNTISADVSDPRSGRTGQATIAFTVSFEGKSPAVVQQVANELASFYLSENIKVREKQSQGTTRFMEDEMKGLQAELAKIDGSIASYKRQNIHALPELAQMNMQLYDSFDRDYRQLSEQLKTLREKESFLQYQLSVIPTDAANQDKTRLNELRVRLVDLKSRFSEKHPDVIKTKAELAELTKQLRAVGRDTPETKPDNPAYINLDSQLAGTRSDIESVKRQMADLQQKRDSIRKRIEASPRVEEGYKFLLVQRNNLQLKFDDLSKKFMESRVAQGLEKGQMGERFTLIDAARLPEKPVSPNIPAILLIGLVLGIGSGVGMAALRENSDFSVYGIDKLAKATKLPVLAAIPEIVTPQDLIDARRKRNMVLIGTTVSCLTCILLFHFLIMDLNVFWAKLLRRLAI
jgi:polysaccharide chain length determinant protein (PEP-CTERM system associated)